MKKYALIIALVILILIVVLMKSNLLNSKQSEASICDAILNLSEKHQCLLDLVFENQDPSVCKKFEYGGDNEGCYAIIAALKNDSTICDNIDDETNRKICLVPFVNEKS